MKQIQTIITDDLNGIPGASTVYFSFEGRAFEIDLTDENRNEMLFVMRRYIDAARTRRLVPHQQPMNGQRRKRTPKVEPIANPGDV